MLEGGWDLIHRKGARGKDKQRTRKAWAEWRGSSLTRLEGVWRGLQGLATCHWVEINPIGFTVWSQHSPQQPAPSPSCFCSSSGPVRIPPGKLPFRSPHLMLHPYLNQTRHPKPSHLSLSLPFSRYLPSSLDKIYSLKYQALTIVYLLERRAVWQHSRPWSFSQGSPPRGVNLTGRIRSKPPSPKALLDHQC